MRALTYLALGVLALGVAGCGSDDGPNDQPGTGDDTGSTVIEAPPFQGGGQTAAAKIQYPAGPYGIDKGSIITNYKFRGYVNSQVNMAELQEIELADFYNPDGQQVWGPGGKFPEGQAKPKGLIITVGSVWCPPCNQEAATVLPAEYAHYKPLGGEFLFQLADGPTQGTAAKLVHLSGWVNKYKVNYPAVLDPSYKLSELFAQAAYPANLMVKTADMRIVEVVAGIPAPSFWAKFDKVLAGEI